MHWLMRVFKNVSSRYIAGFLNILLLHFELKHFEKKKKKNCVTKTELKFHQMKMKMPKAFVFIFTAVFSLFS